MALFRHQATWSSLTLSVSLVLVFRDSQWVTLQLRGRVAARAGLVGVNRTARQVGPLVAVLAARLEPLAPPANERLPHGVALSCAEQCEQLGAVVLDGEYLREGPSL